MRNIDDRDCHSALTVNVSDTCHTIATCLTLTKGVAKIEVGTFRIVHIINLNEYQSFFGKIKLFVNNRNDIGYEDVGIIAVEGRNKNKIINKYTVESRYSEY